MAIIGLILFFVAGAMYSFALGLGPLIFSGIMFIMGFIVLVAIKINKKIKNKKEIKKKEIKAGNVVAIIGGIIGILSVTLFYVLPEIFSFWKIETDFFGMGKKYYGGIGFLFNPLSLSHSFTFDIFLILMGVFVIAGGILILIGGIAHKKVMAITGGFVLLVGPILLVITILLQYGTIGFIFRTELLGQNPIFGTATIHPYTYTWGVWIGWFMAIGGGIAGIIGGVFCD